MTRRNEGKREAIKDLWSQNENQALQENKKKLMEDNGSLHLRLQKLTCETEARNRSTSFALISKHSAPLSKMKALFTIAFGATDSP